VESEVRKRELKVVRLIEPDLCDDCRFAARAQVETKDGKIQSMVYCRRLDCDNWDTKSAEPARRLQLDGEEQLD
jgi:hypothetical protein